MRKGVCESGARQRDQVIFACPHSGLRHNLHFVWKSDRQRLEFKFPKKAALFISILLDGAPGYRRPILFITREGSGCVSWATALSPASDLIRFQPLWAILQAHTFSRPGHFRISLYHSCSFNLKHSPILLKHIICYMHVETVVTYFALGIPKSLFKSARDT